MNKNKNKPCEIDRLPENSTIFWALWIEKKEGKEAHDQFLAASAQEFENKKTKNGE